MKRTSVLLVLCVACAHHDKSNAASYLVKGHAYDSCDDRPATGRVVRLVDSNRRVLAESTVAVDGSFSLQPARAEKVDTRLFVDSGGQWVRLYSTYAEWVANGVYSNAVAYFPCNAREGKGAAPREAKESPPLEEDTRPKAPPSKKLLVPTVR